MMSIIIIIIAIIAIIIIEMVTATMSTSGDLIKPTSFPKMQLNVASAGRLGHAGACAKGCVASCVRPGVAESKVNRRCPEARLFRLLQKLPPDARRRCLARCFSECQRLALEQWLLVQRAASCAARQAEPTSWPCVATVSKKSRPSACRDTQPVLASEISQAQKCCGRWPQPRAGVRGVHSHRSARQTLYNAKVSIGPFLLYTRQSPDLPTVLRFHEVLLAIREQVNRSSHVRSMADCFSEAVAEVPKAHGLDAGLDMGLCFVVSVGAKYWVGKNLTTPRFTIADLKAGVSAWQRLAEARGLAFAGRANRYTILQLSSPCELAAAWSKLRVEYISICTGLGHCQKSVSAKLQELEDRHQACRDRLLARWAAIQGSSRPEKMRPKPGSRQIIECKIDNILKRWVQHKRRAAAQAQPTRKRILQP
mmetsp:Transcript_17078/g.31044  ORF Transcript_17078/g.31044 Transcript_17078/m.31044 type:complete len:423 (-) Transcript_17078:111-1379(-)